MGNVNRSTFLFATPSWAEGAGRIMDFGNHMTEYNVSEGSVDADARATSMDWAAVGDDLRAAIGQVTEVASGR